jgi:hypothetical protein
MGLKDTEKKAGMRMVAFLGLTEGRARILRDPSFLPQFLKDFHEFPVKAFRGWSFKFKTTKKSKILEF